MNWNFLGWNRRSTSLVRGIPRGGWHPGHSAIREFREFIIKIGNAGAFSKLEVEGAIEWIIYYLVSGCALRANHAIEKCYKSKECL